MLSYLHVFGSQNCVGLAVIVKKTVYLRFSISDNLITLESASLDIKKKA